MDKEKHYTDILLERTEHNFQLLAEGQENILHKIEEIDQKHTANFEKLDRKGDYLASFLAERIDKVEGRMDKFEGQLDKLERTFTREFRIVNAKIDGLTENQASFNTRLTTIEQELRQ